MTDLKMPNMNGLEFVHEVRKFNRVMPIVFVSGHSSREHFKEFLALDIDAFIEKPFREIEIVHVAQRAVRTRDLRDAMLALSRTTFKAYVLLQKLSAYMAKDGIDPIQAKDQALLADLMEEMRTTTQLLLESEKNA